MTEPKLTLSERLALAGKKAKEAPALATKPEIKPESEPAPMTALQRIMAKKSKPADPGPEPSKESVSPIKSEPLTNVISMANLVNQGSIAEARAESTSIKAMENIDMSMIRQRIVELENSGLSELKSQMDVLRAMLLSNPEACQLMLPQDLGLLVRSLRRMTDNRVAADLGRAKPRKTAADTVPKLTQAEIAAAVEDGDWDL